MSNFCNPCKRAHDILTCVDKLEICRISFPLTKVFVYIHNHTTGKTVIVLTTSDSFGYVAINIYTRIQLMDGHDYSIKILKHGFKHIDDIHNMIIGTETVSCVGFNARRLVNTDNTTNIINQSITLIP